MTERELSQARYLTIELERLRGLEERSAEVAALIERHTQEVELARFEVMAYIATIPDPKIRVIAVMRYLEGKSWETIARRLHYERTSPAKQLRRFLKK